MTHSQRSGYVAAFALGLGGGVTLERYRAHRGGIHRMCLVHHESGVSVERYYDDLEPVLPVLNELLGELRTILAGKGLSWSGD